MLVSISLSHVFIKCNSSNFLCFLCMGKTISKVSNVLVTNLMLLLNIDMAWFGWPLIAGLQINKVQPWKGRIQSQNPLGSCS